MNSAVRLLPAIRILLATVLLAGCVAGPDLGPSSAPPIGSAGASPSDAVPAAVSSGSVASSEVPAPHSTPSLGPPAVGAPGSIFGPPGTIVTVEEGSDAVDVISSSPDGHQIGTISRPLPSGWESDEGPDGLVSLNGWLALGGCLHDLDHCGQLVFDLGHPDELPVLT
jgi:hypothetical protein